MSAFMLIFLIGLGNLFLFLALYVFDYMNDLGLWHHTFSTDGQLTIGEMLCVYMFCTALNVIATAVLFFLLFSMIVFVIWDKARNVIPFLSKFEWSDVVIDIRKEKE